MAETPVYADGTAAVEHSVYWLYEPGALTPGARYENGQLHYVVRDHMGTPRELLTETGEVVRAQKLSVWGKAEQYRFGGPGAANDEDNAPHCPWRFAGQYADDESGLHYNRFRYYDAETGQYVSPDPIGLRGGINPYSYVKNPLMWIDPLGLTGWQIDGDKTTAILQGGPFKEKYYKDGRTGLWWSKDTTGHGGSAYKVYRETSTTLEWIADADENGQFMPDKHKGNTGRSIPKKGCKGIK
ncbi:putative deoxyribonuclease RhsC [Salmonella enterica]|nr:putative deoxyribonuclease RhsC [Salmonella enterica]GAS77280.1 putative deoxyribonuclease RhsC [Salmonella enterica]